MIVNHIADIYISGKIKLIVHVLYITLQCIHSTVYIHSSVCTYYIISVLITTSQQRYIRRPLMYGYSLFISITLTINVCYR